MTEPTAVDPKAKASLQITILAAIYEIPFQRLTQRMAVLVKQNLSLPAGKPMLRLRGQIYDTNGEPQYHGMYYDTCRLHPALQDQALQWLADLDELDEERRLVRYSLATVFTASNNIQDYLELIPERLHPILENYRPVLSDAATTKRLTPEAMAKLRQVQSPYLTLMGQRYVLSLIL